MVTESKFYSPLKETRMANTGSNTSAKFYKGIGNQQDYGAGTVNKFRNIAQAQEDDSGYEGYLRKIYGLEKTDKEYKRMPGFLKRDIRDSYRDDVESGTYKDPYRDQDQSSILKRAGDFVANVFTPPAIAGTLEGKPTRYTMGESNVPSISTPNVGDMVGNIEAAVEIGGRGGLDSSGIRTLRSQGRPQARVVSPMEAGMGPGAAKARAMAKARNAAKESGTAAPSMSGADRAKALARARIARKKSSTSSGTGFGRSTSSSRRSTGRAGRRGGSAGSAGSRSRGATGSASRRSASSSRRSNTSRSRRSGRSTSSRRGGSFGGSRRRGGRRGRRGGRRCDLRCKVNISLLTSMNLMRDDLAEVAYFVKELQEIN